MANFPTSVYSPSAVSNGQTIDASRDNGQDAELTAIEQGYLQGTAPLNSSNSTTANLSVTGGSTTATLSVTGGSTVGALFTSSATIAVVNSTNSNGLRLQTGSTTALTIDTTQFIDSPTQPRAKVWKSASQSINNGAATLITWDTEDFDVGALHDTAVNNSRFTCPTGGDGLYLAHAGLQFAVNSSGLRVVYINKNGSLATVGVTQVNAVTVANQTVLQASGLVNLAATDYVEVQAFQGSGAALNVEGAAITNSWFSIVKLW